MMNEERTDPISFATFASFFDKDNRLVKEHEFRQAVFRNGIDDEIRQCVWKFLFQFYPFNSTPRERFIRNKEKFVEYALMKCKWKQLVEKCGSVPMLSFDLRLDPSEDLIASTKKNIESEEEINKFVLEEQVFNVDSMKIQQILQLARLNIDTTKLFDDIKQIDKDIDRTGYLIELARSKTPQIAEQLSVSLRNILITFAAFNQSTDQSNLGYTQGMNELASVFLSVFDQESVAYWCFSNFMLLDSFSRSSISLNTSTHTNHVLNTNVAHYFCDKGISKKLKHLSYLLEKTDPVLFKQFEAFQLGDMSIFHEHLMLNFKRCFSTTEQFQRCFEMLASHFLELHQSSLKNVSIESIYSFDLFLCLSLLKQMRENLLTKCESDVDMLEVFKEFNAQRSPFGLNFHNTFQLAEQIFDKYSIMSQADALMGADEKPTNQGGFLRFKNFLFNSS